MKILESIFAWMFLNPEKFGCLVATAYLLFWGTIAYIILHFLMKYW